jgi:hypothetical protein
MLKSQTRVPESLTCDSSVLKKSANATEDPHGTSVPDHRESKVSALKEFAKRQPKLAPALSTLICVAIFAERANSFAQAQQQSALDIIPPAPEGLTGEDNRPKKSADNKIDLPLPPAKPAAKKNKEKPSKTDLLEKIPLEMRAVQKFEGIKTKQEACRVLEGKVVTYYDSAALVSGCIQRPIEDPDLLNELVFKRKRPVAEVPAHVYRLIPFGEPYAGQESAAKNPSSVCRDLNGKYVTTTGTDYYFIEACKKRPFSSYVELQAHNKGNLPVLIVSPDQIDRLATGKSLEGNYDREVNALYKIVGDSSLTTLGTKGTKPVGSTEDLEALPNKSAKKQEGKNLCKELNNTVVSFYSQLFYISNCQKRPIRELPIAIQQKFSERGTSVQDVSSNQLDSIPTGKELSADEADALIK